MFLFFSFLSFSRYFSCFYLFIYFLLLGAYCQPHNVRDSKFAVTEAYGFKLLIFQLAVFFFSFFLSSLHSSFLSSFLSSFPPSFLPFFSFSLSLLKTSLKWRNEPRLKKRGSIGKSRLDCVIEPRMSQSGKTRYRGRFRSRVFGLVYQKPWVILIFSPRCSVLGSEG